MDFTQFLLMVLMSIQPWYADPESWEDRQARMTIVAQSINSAADMATCQGQFAVPKCKRIWPRSKKELAMLLVTKGWWESKFAKHVHEGKCGPKECDAEMRNGVIVHMARSPWQIQETGWVKKGEWEKINKADLVGTVTAATIAARALSYGYNYCNTIEGAIGAYGGAGCSWPGSANRAHWFRKQLAKTEANFQTEMAAREKTAREAEAKKKEAAEKKLALISGN